MSYNYTVGIPAFNAERTLERVLAAVINFDPVPEKIIVVNDYSSDSTEEIAAHFPVQVINHAKQRGLAGARNTILSETVTDLLLWLDSDFVPHERVPNALISGLKDDSIAGVGGRAFESVQKSAADRWRRIHASQDHGSSTKEEAWMIMGLCCLHRVDVLRGVGGFDERFVSCAEDVEMSLRLRKCGYRLVYRPDAYGDHLRSDDAASLTSRMADYVRWTSYAFMLHGFKPRRHFAPIFAKQAIFHPLVDFLAFRFKLIPLDIRINKARWNVLRNLSPTDLEKL